MGRLLTGFSPFVATHGARSAAADQAQIWPRSGDHGQHLGPALAILRRRLWPTLVLCRRCLVHMPGPSFRVLLR